MDYNTMTLLFAVIPPSLERARCIVSLPHERQLSWFPSHDFGVGYGASARLERFMLQHFMNVKGATLIM
jgi:hypothetical protein